jgi:uncharacterized protein YggU (UPF0235/DUF167 family)
VKKLFTDVEIKISNSAQQGKANECLNVHENNSRRIPASNAI